MGVPEGADATGFGCPGVLAVLGLEAAAPGECELTRLLQDKLQYEMRLQYMVTPALGGGGAHVALQGPSLLQGGHDGGSTHCSTVARCWVLCFLPETICAKLCPELLLLGAGHIKSLLHRLPGVMLRLAHYFALCQPPCSSLPFQKHYFPIDYTVQVQYEEVLRPSNITRLVRGWQGRVPWWEHSRDPRGLHGSHPLAL